MDCNKEEAIKAKELAVQKYVERDDAGALELALKAQALCPELEGISQLVETLRVISTVKTSHGEVDVYAALGVQPSADENTIRKSYKKLALLLHPDKNKFYAAESAFKIVSEAWSLLSDEGKRLCYDLKHNLRSINTNDFKGKSSLSVPASQNGFHNFSDHDIFNARDHRPHVHPTFDPPSPPMSHYTFWTGCSTCKMQFQYLRSYLNRTLLCASCGNPFLAVEIQAPPINVNNASTPWASSMPRQSFDHVHNAWPPSFSGIHSSMGTSQPGTSSKSGIYAQQSGEQLKKGVEEAEKKLAGLGAGSSCAGPSSAVKIKINMKRRHDVL